MPRHTKAELPKPAPVHLVDTNIILRFLIGDNPPHAQRASALMSRVERGEEIVEITDEVVTEAVWTLASFYKVPRVEIAEKLAALFSFRGVRLVKHDVIVQALDKYAASTADFVDCLLAARSQARKIPVYTFDETDFKKLAIAWEHPS